eukprot:8239216-Alexandrium_andersonii.AAC.1
MRMRRRTTQCHTVTAPLLFAPFELPVMGPAILGPLGSLAIAQAPPKLAAQVAQLLVALS